jgi:hypothetical protein
LRRDEGVVEAAGLYEGVPERVHEVEEP